MFRENTYFGYLGELRMVEEMRLLFRVEDSGARLSDVGSGKWKLLSMATAYNREIEMRINAFLTS